jgi:hypothetical protein
MIGISFLKIISMSVKERENLCDGDLSDREPCSFSTPLDAKMVAREESSRIVARGELDICKTDVCI